MIEKDRLWEYVPCALPSPTSTGANSLNLLAPIMSARMPFVPTARPESRTAQPKAQPQVSDKPATDNAAFVPDFSNALHASSNNQQSSSVSQSTPHDSNKTINPLSLKAPGSSNPIISATHRPFNTSGLIKKSSKSVGQGQRQNQHLSRMPEGPIIRPGTADPHSTIQHNEPQNYCSIDHDQVLNIVAPVPLQALSPPPPVLSITQASGKFVSSSFKAPVAHEKTTEGDAHTSTSALGFSLSKSKSTMEQHQTQLPSPPTSVRIKSARSFESHSVIEMDHEMPSFTFDASLKHKTGPQRALVNHDGARSSMNGSANQALQSTNQTQFKRTRGELEQTNADPKRYKRSTGEYNTRSQGMPSPQHISSPDPHSFHSQYHQTHSRSPQQELHNIQEHPQNHTPLTPLEPHYQQDDQDTLMGDAPRALDKLLGRDTDAYIEDHMDKYDRATERWRDCGMEEWIAGADEIAARYGKILDFVKSHMATKMKLFAGFDVKVDAHNAILVEREKLLDGVKERLVSESGNVLGRS